MSSRLDSSAVAQLYQRHGSVVYRRAYQLLGDRGDAEEAVQEVFIRILRSPELDKRNGRLTTWLYEVTTNYCLNKLRDARRRRELHQEHDAPRLDTGMPGHDTLLFVRRLIAEADAQQARAVVYVHLDGMSQAEASQLLGVSQRTVSNLIDRFTRWAKERAGLDATADTTAEEEQYEPP